jgi:hypothetical protein
VAGFFTEGDLVFTRQPVSAFFPVLFFLLAAPLLFPLGKKEEEPKEPRNTEWILSVTAFDVSALPESRRAVGELLQRGLVDSLNSVSYRIRVSPEYAWYEGRAWVSDQGTAAKALAAKREERDRLLFRGDPRWRYRRSLKTLEGEIKKLEETLRKVEVERPPVEKEPLFRLTQGNQEGDFPVPPGAGREYRFCQDQKADAFLTGTVSEYYGRIFVALKLYTAYTGTYIYEDSIIFSSDNIVTTAEEFSGRLTAVVSGADPAEISVSTDLPESLILINNSFAGQGELVRRERPPGRATVEIIASGYESAQEEVELKSGELTEITAKLQPQELGEVRVESRENPGLSVYLGAQYMGQAPLTLMLPLNRLEHIYAESPRGDVAELVFPVKPPDTGAVSLPKWLLQDPSQSIFGKKSYLDDNKLVIYTKPFSARETRVSSARRQYYWAWGGTWITGIAAWMLYGNYKIQSDSLYASPNPRKDMYDSALQASYMAMGSIGLVSLAVLVEAIQMGRYIQSAGQDAPAMVK